MSYIRAPVRRMIGRRRLDMGHGFQGCVRTPETTYTSQGRAVRL